MLFAKPGTVSAAECRGDVVWRDLWELINQEGFAFHVRHGQDRGNFEPGFVGTTVGLGGVFEIIEQLKRCQSTGARRPGVAWPSAYIYNCSIGFLYYRSTGCTHNATVHLTALFPIRHGEGRNLDWSFRPTSSDWEGVPFFSKSRTSRGPLLTSPFQRTIGN